MNKIIKLLEGIKSNKKGLEDFEALKAELSDDEIKLVEVVFDLVSEVAHWAAEQSFCATGILLEAKDDYDPKAVVKALKIAAKFGVNPLLLVRLIHSIGLDIKPGDLLGTLAEEYNATTGREEDKETACKSHDDEETIEDIQKELADMIKKFNEN